MTSLHNAGNHFGWDVRNRRKQCFSATCGGSSCVNVQAILTAFVFGPLLHKLILGSLVYLLGTTLHHVVSGISKDRALTGKS